MPYVLMFFAGALLCNAIPHLVSGLRGERFFTPWARPRGIGRSSAIENFLWGSANLLTGAFILSRIWGDQIPHGLAVLAAGFVLAGAGLSYIFARRNAG